MLIACLGMEPTHTTFMIRIKLAKLLISPIRLHSASTIRPPSSVNNFRNMLPTIRISPLGSPIIRSTLNHLLRPKELMLKLELKFIEASNMLDKVADPLRLGFVSSF